MCLIIVKPENVEMPSNEIIKSAERMNDDGIGIAWTSPEFQELVRIKKDFKNSDDFIAWCKEHIKPEFPCIIHFRLRTHGRNDIGNRHPFPITQNKQLLRAPETTCRQAMVHNGILSNYQHEKYSDTQKFIIDILASPEVSDNLDKPAIKKLILNFLGSCNKVAILEYTGKIRMFGGFECEKGLYFSNSNYKWSHYYGYSTYDDDEYGVHYPKGMTSAGLEDSCAANNEKSTDKFNAWMMCDLCDSRKSKTTIIHDEITYEVCDKCADRLEKGLMKVCECCNTWFHKNNMVVIRELDNEWVCDKCAKALQLGIS